MNPTSTNHKNDMPIRSRGRLKWIVAISTIPFLFLIAAACFLGYRESIASSQLNQRIDEIRRAGLPYDDETMGAWFARETSKEGTEAWSEILSLCKQSQNISRDFPILGPNEMPKDFMPGCEWPDEPRVAEFLKELQPVVRRIHKANELSKPVWMPIQFNGFQTLLEEVQESRSVARLLLLDAYHAMHQEDRERVMKDLRSIQGTAQAFDWNICLVSQLVTIAIRSIHRTTITSTLSMDIWNDEDLAQLSEQLKRPSDGVKMWKEGLAGERAMMYSALDDPSVFFNSNDPGSQGMSQFMKMLPLLASGRVHILDSYHELIEVGTQGRKGLKERAKAWENRFVNQQRLRWGFDASDYYLGMVMPATVSYAEAIARDENLRRLTLVSVLIKRFQLKHTRWPTTLNELTEFGLGSEEWSNMDSKAFGYEVRDDVAYVWDRILVINGRDVRTKPAFDPQLDGSEWSIAKIR